MKKKDGFGIARGIGSFTEEDKLKSCFLEEMEKEENKPAINKSKLKNLKTKHFGFYFLICIW